MKTQFFFDQFISLCHVLMCHYSLHFNLEHSTRTDSSKLIIYFDFDDKGLVDVINDFVAQNYPFFTTTLIVFKDKDPFKVLRVQIK